MPDAAAPVPMRLSPATMLRSPAYRETTLTAFQQVEDNLAALRILEGEERQQREAVAAAQESLQLFTNRYQGGVDNYLQVITAQTIALTNERNEIDIQRRRMDASVLLIKALGGGWKHQRTCPVCLRCVRAERSLPTGK